MKQTEKITRAFVSALVESLHELMDEDTKYPEVRRAYLDGFTDISMRVATGAITKREGMKIADERKAALVRFLFLKFLKEYHDIGDMYIKALYHEMRGDA